MHNRILGQYKVTNEDISGVDMSSKYISVAIVCTEKYNMHIADAVSSLSGQARLEWVIGTDNSDTVRIVRENMSSGDTINIIRVNPDIDTVSIMKNKVRSECGGDYILCMDADDVFHDNALSVLMTYLDKYDDIVAVSPSLSYFGTNERYRTTYEEFYDDPMLNYLGKYIRYQDKVKLNNFNDGNIMWYASCSLYRRVVQDKIKYVIPSIGTTEDRFMGWEVFNAFPFGYLRISIPLLHYRKNPGYKSVSKTANELDDDDRIFRMKYFTKMRVKSVQAIKDVGLWDAFIKKCRYYGMDAERITKRRW